MSVVVLVVPGCVEKEPLDPCSEACEPVPVLEAALPVAWEGCRGALALLEVPYESVARLVPESLILLGTTSQTASLMVSALRCERAAADRSMAADVAIAQLVAHVRPRDEASNGGPGGSHLSLFLAASDAGIQSALVGLGLDAHTATFEARPISSPVGAAAEAWTFSTDTAKIELEFAHSGLPYAQRQSPLHHWHETADGLLRVDANVDRATDLIVKQAGFLRLVGGPLETEQLPWTGQAFDRWDETWTFASEPFGGAK